MFDRNISSLLLKGSTGPNQYGGDFFLTRHKNQKRSQIYTVKTTQSPAPQIKRTLEERKQIAAKSSKPSRTVQN